MYPVFLLSILQGFWVWRRRLCHRCASVSYGSWTWFIFDVTHTPKFLFYPILRSSLKFSAWIGPPSHLPLLQDVKEEFSRGSALVVVSLLLSLHPATLGNCVPLLHLFPPMHATITTGLNTTLYSQYKVFWFIQRFLCCRNVDSRLLWDLGSLPMYLTSPYRCISSPRSWYSASCVPPLHF